MHTNFSDFPSIALTVEFWMWSVDVCNQGTPISYAVEGADNAFLLYDYTDWYTPAFSALTEIAPYLCSRFYLVKPKGHSL